MDAYHLAGIEMPDFARKEDWWKQGDNLYLDNLEATDFYRVNATEAQPGDILICCFGSSVAIRKFGTRKRPHGHAGC